MRSKDIKFNVQYSTFDTQKLRILTLVCILMFIGGGFSCAVPNLEKPECREARQTVKEFYSFHFGNEMKFTAENLRLREKFLTPEFTKSLSSSDTENDRFTTNSIDFPKAFRVGECRVEAADKTVFEVLLFWKDDYTSRQQEISVETVKQNDKWLINRVSSQ